MVSKSLQFLRVIHHMCQSREIAFIGIGVHEIFRSKKKKIIITRRIMSEKSHQEQVLSGALKHYSIS
jgi:hypothetical protein